MNGSIAVPQASVESAAPQGPDSREGRRITARAIGGWILRLGVGAGIIAYLLSFISLSAVVEALSTATPAWIAVALALVAAERVTGAVRATVLCNHAGLSLSVWQNLRISLSATFYGLVLPGELAGGAVRWYKMSRRDGMRAEAAAVISFDRLIDTIVLVLAGFVFWLLEGPSLASTAVEIGLLALLGVLLGMLCVSLSRTATSALLIPLAKIAQRLRIGFVYRSIEKVVNAVSGFRELRPGAIATLVLISVLRQLLAIGILFGFAAALETGVGFITLGWVRTFMNIAVMLPVSISGLGVREGTLVFLLRPYDVPGSLALALSLLMLLSHIVVAAAGGLLELRSFAFRTRDRQQPGSEQRVKHPTGTPINHP